MENSEQQTGVFSDHTQIINQTDLRSKQQDSFAVTSFAEATEQFRILRSLLRDMQEKVRVIEIKFLDATKR